MRMHGSCEQMCGKTLARMLGLHLLLVGLGLVIMPAIVNCLAYHLAPRPAFPAYNTVADVSFWLNTHSLIVIPFAVLFPAVTTAIYAVFAWRSLCRLAALWQACVIVLSVSLIVFFLCGACAPTAFLIRRCFVSN